MVVPLARSRSVGSPSPRASMTRPANSGARSAISISTPGPSRTTDVTVALVAFQHQRLRVAAEHSGCRVDRGVESATDDDLAAGAGGADRVLPAWLVRPPGIQRLVGVFAAVRVQGNAGQLRREGVRELRLALHHRPHSLGGAGLDGDGGQQGLDLRGRLKDLW